MGPRRFAVVGSPVGHSLSPALHRAAYAALGIRDAQYTRFEVPAGMLEEFLVHGPGRELSGLSVTMPGKPEAFALAAETDATSRSLGVANTLLRRDDGSWRAENHDVHGIMAALRDHGGGTGGSGAVLGSGATALSAVAALIGLGVDTVLLSARSAEKLTPLEDFARGLGAEVRRIPWDRQHEVLTADMVVSALAIDGARAVAAQWRTLPSLPRTGVLLDVLYDPWPAPLAAVVAEAGGEVADGLEMLAHQADMQLRSMLGVPAAPVAQMLAAAREELGRRPQEPPG
ncbi:shikimate dehydrogenase [Brachybacterium vulturis]|uniref:Shikimate dehydrogenase n=1 Tax=Brachybacterium vulturis TaxID=2017484 RepID=A0A291GP61_9MICO|nr:shikimate dehydrogenase [Brachybacterium vulturis]ATG51947.1 shikimate dehydrogenase [Brachybacterium vulturis]